jgi:hypothetical protein
MRLAAALSAVGTTAATITLAVPARADVDTDFANQAHTYGIYGQRDYNAWLAKITCERLDDGCRQGGGQPPSDRRDPGGPSGTGFHPAQPRPHRRSTTTHLVDRCRVGQAENHVGAREEWLAGVLQDGLTEDERRAVRHAMALLDRIAEPDSATTD